MSKLTVLVTLVDVYYREMDRAKRSKNKSHYAHAELCEKKAEGILVSAVALGIDEKEFLKTYQNIIGA